LDLQQRGPSGDPYVQEEDLLPAEIGLGHGAVCSCLTLFESTQLHKNDAICILLKTEFMALNN
jgi:hypothetical protein